MSQAAYYLSRSFWFLIYIIEQNVRFETHSQEARSLQAMLMWARMMMERAVAIGLMPERPLLQNVRLAKSSGFLDTIPTGKNYAVDTGVEPADPEGPTV